MTSVLERWSNAQALSRSSEDPDTADLQYASEPTIVRSAHLEEYSKHRPQSAGGMRPRTLLQKVAQASGLQAEDSDVDADADPWVLEGWGEEPSVPEKARQASTKMLAKWAKNLPSALPPANMPGQRRILSAGPHRGSPTQRKPTDAGGRRRPGDGPDTTSLVKQGIANRRVTQPMVRRCYRPQHADLEVGDESDLEPSDHYHPSPPPPQQQQQQSPAPASGRQSGSNGVGLGRPTGLQTQQLIQLLNGKQKALDSGPFTSEEMIEMGGDLLVARSSPRAPAADITANASGPSPGIQGRTRTAAPPGPMDPLSGAGARGMGGLGQTRAVTLASVVPPSARAAAMASRNAADVTNAAQAAMAAQASVAAARTAAKAKLQADLELLLQRRSALHRQPMVMGMTVPEVTLDGGLPGQYMLEPPPAIDQGQDGPPFGMGFMGAGLQTPMQAPVPQLAVGRTGRGGSQPPVVRQQVPTAVQQLDLDLPLADAVGKDEGGGQQGAGHHGHACAAGGRVSGGVSIPHPRGTTTATSTTRGDGGGTGTGATGTGPGPPRAVGGRGPPPHMLRITNQLSAGFDPPPGVPAPTTKTPPGITNKLRRMAPSPTPSGADQLAAQLQQATQWVPLAIAGGSVATDSGMAAGQPGAYRRVNSDQGQNRKAAVCAPPVELQRMIKQGSSTVDAGSGKGMMMS